MTQLNCPRCRQNQDLHDLRMNKIAVDGKSSKSSNPKNPDSDNKKSKS